MEMSIESQLELTKVNKIASKLAEGYSVADVCKDLGLSTRELVKYVLKEDISKELGNNHEAFKMLVMNKLSLLVESSLDKIEALQQDLVLELEPEAANAIAAKITAMTNLVNTYLKSITVLEKKVEDKDTALTGLSEETLKLIQEKILYM